MWEELAIPETDIMGNRLSYPEVDLSSRVAIVTGGNSGIGYETAKGLAAMGAHTIIACRSRERAEEVYTWIRVFCIAVTGRRVTSNSSFHNVSQPFASILVNMPFSSLLFHWPLGSLTSPCTPWCIPLFGNLHSEVQMHFVKWSSEWCHLISTCKKACVAIDIWYEALISMVRRIHCNNLENGTLAKVHAWSDTIPYIQHCILTCTHIFVTNIPSVVFTIFCI